MLHAGDHVTNHAGDVVEDVLFDAPLFMLGSNRSRSCRPLWCRPRRPDEQARPCAIAHRKAPRRAGEPGAGCLGSGLLGDGKPRPRLRRAALPPPDEARHCERKLGERISARLDALQVDPGRAAIAGDGHGDVVLVGDGDVHVAAVGGARDGRPDGSLAMATSMGNIGPSPSCSEQVVIGVFGGDAGPPTTSAGGAASGGRTRRARPHPGTAARSVPASLPSGSGLRR